MRPAGRQHGRWSRGPRAAGATLVCLTLGVVALLPATAGAELAWQGTQQLSTEQQNAAAPRVATNARGDAVVVWRRFDGDHWRLEAAFRAPGQNFDPALTQTVSPEEHGAVGAYDVALDAQGNAIVVWSRQDLAVNTYVHYATRAPGGRFGAASEVGSSIGSGSPRVAMDAQGNAVVVAVASVGSPYFSRVRAAARPAGGAFGSWQELSTPGDGTHATAPQVALDGAGNALAAWQITDFGGYRRVQAAQRPAGGAFGPGVVVSPAGDARAPRLAMSAQGAAALVWDFDTHGSVDGRDHRVQAALRAPGGAFGTAQTLSALSAGHNRPFARVAVDQQGAAVAGWRRYDLDTRATQTEAASRPAGGSFGAAQALSASAPGLHLPPVDDAQVGVRGTVVAAARSGDALVGWRRFEGSSDVIEVRAREGGGAFGTVHTLTEPGRDAGSLEAAMDGAGNAIAVWVRSDGANDRIEARVGLAPVGGSPRPPPPLPPPPPPPPPPVPSAIRVEKPMERGSATVLTADVAGPVTRLEWQVPGSAHAVVGAVVGGQLQRSIRFRPPPGRTFTVQVRAVGPGGERTFARSLSAPRAPVGAAAGRVAQALAGTPGVFAVGHAPALLGQAGGACATTVVAAATTFSGCLRAVDGLADIPVGERGVLDRLARELGLPRDAESTRLAVELSESFVSRAATTINGGLPVVPRGNASIVAFPAAKAVASSNAGLRVGGIDLSPPGGFTLALDPRAKQIPLGTFPKPPQLPSIGGFPFVGDIEVRLVGSEAIVTGNLKLPSWIKRAGVDLQARARLRATADRLILEDLVIGPLDASVGALDVEGLRLAYTRAGDAWQGQGKACIVGGACLDMVPPNGQIKIVGGRLDFAGASLRFPAPGVPLFPGVQLERIGFGMGLDPTRVTGNAQLAFARVLILDGRLVLAFPSAATPFTLRRDEVGDGFPAHLYGPPFTRATIGASANARLRLPAIGEVPLANAYVLYEYPGYFAFGGSFGVTFVRVVTIEGGVAGEFDVTEGLFNLTGRVRACVADVACGGAIGAVSRGRGGTGGAGACVEVGPVQVGGGVQWQRVSAPFIWPLDGCKWSRFTAVVRGARAAAAGGHVVHVRRGEPGRAIELRGEGGVPAVRVTGPGGLTLDSPAGAGLATSPDGAVRIMRSPQTGLLVVGIESTRPGIYRIATLDGSPAVAAVAEASDLPDARVRASVSGRGALRVLRYDVGRRPEQRVTFYDVGRNGAAKAIGSIAGGGRGTLRFAPAPGAGMRRVEARFELAGLPAETRAVARFRPPSPRLATPRRVQVRRARTTLRVRWRPVAGAGRYELAVTTSSGPQRFLTTRRTSALVRGVPRAGAGRVTVRAVARLRTSAPARAGFRRLAARTSAFRPLPRCTARRRGPLVCRGKGTKRPAKRTGSGRRRR